MDPIYHVELDDLDFPTGEDITKSRMMVGGLNWLVTLGRYNIHFATYTLTYYMMIPRQGHMHAMRRTLGHLKANYKLYIEYDISEPNLPKYKIEKYD